MISEQKKREIETLLAEYKQDVEAYEKWMEAWRERQSKPRWMQRRDRTA